MTKEPTKESEKPSTVRVVTIKILAVIAALAVLAGIVLVIGLMTVVLWNIGLGPFGVPHIGITQAVAILLLILTLGGFLRSADVIEALKKKEREGVTLVPENVIIITKEDGPDPFEIMGMPRPHQGGTDGSGSN